MQKLSRYEQQIELTEVGVSGQKKIFDARVLIVGAGGLGCPAALYLAGAGVGTIGLIDGDQVNVTNLHRQLLYTDQDIGKEKVSCAEKQLSRIMHHQNLKPYNFFLNANNSEDIISQYDIVVDATDNHLVRLLINEVCLRQKKAWVYGAIYRYEGQTMVFGTKSGPCFSCLFPYINENSALPTCKSSGVLSPVPGIIGTFQALDVLKCILGFGEEITNNLRLMDLLTYQIKSFNVAKDPQCKVCQKYA